MTADEIRSWFGTAVADIVEAASFDPSIDEYLERHYDIYDSCFAVGRPAVLVKAADILDNSDYYGLADSDELAQQLLAKMAYFIEESEPYIGETDLYRDLTEKRPAVRERING